MEESSRTNMKFFKSQYHGGILFVTTSPEIRASWKRVCAWIAIVAPTWICAAVLIVLTCSGTQVLAADSAPVRVCQNLNDGWLFERQINGSGELGSFDRDTVGASMIQPKFRDALMPEYDDSWWNSINLPHTWNAYDVTDAEPGYWRGIGWYRKHFRVDSQYAGRRMVLEFEGVNQTAKIWLNGDYLGSHKGGYTGFSFEISPRFNADNVLTIEVNNLYDATVPPTVKTDFAFYGGIYRSVSLLITNTTFVSDHYCPVNG
jgi:beta-galactosidase/beta-glucuronidase